MSSLVHRMETLIRELTYDHCRIDRPDDELFRVLMARLEVIRGQIGRADAIRMESLIRRGKGVER